MKPFAYLAFASAVILSHCSPAGARPSYQNRLPNANRVPCYEGAEGCFDGLCGGLGHKTCQGGTLPLNNFGQAFLDSGLKWTESLCKADSDGDGFTNGQELGDPCCTWPLAGDLDPAFLPSHPGSADSRLPESWSAPTECGTTTAAPEKERKTAAFNDHEERRSKEFLIRNFTLPDEETTYADFVFNFDDTSHDLFHIVYGEAIVDLPWALHHFVVTGCSEKISPDMEGVFLQKVPEYCNLPVGGFSGWAPGATLWDMPLDSGVPIGKGVNIVAFSLNVHFTDADKAPPEDKPVSSEDGIRVFYTPTLRPRTAYSTNAINIGSGPPEMFIPPNTHRSFIHRQCTVRHRCDDFTHWNEQKVSCSPSLCGTETKVLCPKTCGLCSPEEENESIELFSMFYHAHLLGREMYASLTKPDGTVVDLNSQKFWSFDDQEMYHFEDPVTIRSGDKLDVSCVFDSREREENTPLGLSTYDEMCIHSLLTLHNTSNSRESFRFGAFTCDGNIWNGELRDGESGISIPQIYPEDHAEKVWTARSDGSVIKLTAPRSSTTTPNPSPSGPWDGKRLDLKGAGCPSSSSQNVGGFNGVYAHHGDTMDGRPYYKHEKKNLWIYYDRRCAPSWLSPQPAWIVTSVKPSTEVMELLQYGPGGGRENSDYTDCNNAIRWDTESPIFPINSPSDYIWCGMDHQDHDYRATGYPEGGNDKACEGPKCCTKGTSYDETSGKCVVEYTDYKNILSACKDGDLVNGISCRVPSDPCENENFQD